MRKICPSFIIFLPFLLPIFFPWTSLGGFLHEFLSLLGLVLGTQQFISIKWFAFIAIHVWSYYHRLFFHFVPLLRPKSKNEVALFSFILTFINAFVYVRWRWNKKVGHAPHSCCVLIFFFSHDLGRFQVKIMIFWQSSPPLKSQTYFVAWLRTTRGRGSLRRKTHFCCLSDKRKKLSSPLSSFCLIW